MCVCVCLLAIYLCVSDKISCVFSCVARRAKGKEVAGAGGGGGA